MLINLSSHDQKQIRSLFEDVLGVLNDQKNVIQLPRAKATRTSSDEWAYRCLLKRYAARCVI